MQIPLRFLWLPLVFSALLNAQDPRPTSAPELLWQFPTAGRVSGSPAVHGDHVIVGSESGLLYCLNRVDGKERWRYRAGGGFAGRPAVTKDLVYSTNRDGKLHAVSMHDGNLAWSFATAGEKVVDVWDYYLSSPTVSEGRVYFGSGDGWVYALEADSGKLAWKFHAGAVVHASPLVRDGVVYIGSFAGVFHALDAASGEVKWTFKPVGDRYFPAGAIQGSAALVDGVVYFGSRDYNVYAVDAAKGHAWWNFKEPSWVIGAPAVHDRKVIYGTSDTHEVVARDAHTGAALWKRSTRLNVFADGLILGTTAIWGGFDGRLRALDIGTGDLVWEFGTVGSTANAGAIFQENGELRADFHQRYGQDAEKLYEDILSLGSFLAAPAVADDCLYAGSADGNVYALRLRP